MTRSITNPVLRAMVESFANSLAGSTPVESEQIQNEARYVTLLATHDSSYEFSDDHQAWMHGLNERREIELLQPKVDPDFKVAHLVRGLLQQEVRHG